jgi:hypothetical protein
LCGFPPRLLYEYNYHVVLLENMGDIEYNKTNC